MFSDQYSPRPSLALPAGEPTHHTMSPIFISHRAMSGPTAAPLSSGLRAFGERPVTSVGGARPRPADYPPGQVPPPAAHANRARPHFKITLCMSHQAGIASLAQTNGQSPVHLVYSLALAANILAPYSLPVLIHKMQNLPRNCSSSPPIYRIGVCDATMQLHLRAQKI